MAIKYGAVHGLQGAMAPQQMDRFNQLQNEFSANPGAAPGGTGSTGLLPNDLSGYQDLLKRRTEYMSLLKGLQGAQG